MTWPVAVVLGLQLLQPGSPVHTAIHSASDDWVTSGVFGGRLVGTDVWMVNRPSLVTEPTMLVVAGISATARGRLASTSTAVAKH